MAQAAEAAGLQIDDNQLQQFTRYYELLIEWNEKMNLTAITEPQEVAVKHMVDSLTALETGLFAEAYPTTIGDALLSFAQIAYVASIIVAVITTISFLVFYAVKFIRQIRFKSDFDDVLTVRVVVIFHIGLQQVEIGHKKLALELIGMYDRVLPQIKELLPPVGVDMKNARHSLVVQRLAHTYHLAL